MATVIEGSHRYDKPTQMANIVANLIYNPVPLNDTDRDITPTEVVGVYDGRMLLKLGYHWLEVPLASPLSERTIRYAYSMADGFFPLNAAENQGRLGNLAETLANTVKTGVYFDEVTHRRGTQMPLGISELGKQFAATGQYVRPDSVIGRMIAGVQGAFPLTRAV